MAANNSIFFEDESYTISDVMQDIYKLNWKSLSLLNDWKPATREEAEKIVEENWWAIPTKEEFEMIEKLILSYRALRIRNSISELNWRFWSAELEGEYAHTFTLGERDYRLVPLRYNDIYLVLSLGKN
jgi:hypothetical protein